MSKLSHSIADELVGFEVGDRVQVTDPAISTLHASECAVVISRWGSGYVIGFLGGPIILLRPKISRGLIPRQNRPLVIGVLVVGNPRPKSILLQ